MASDRTLMAKALLSGPSLQRSGSLSTVLRGVGIASIIKTGTSGLIDEYTITYTDGRTQTYEVTNGAQGERGPRGDKGPRGYTGFSAYQYAVNGGYEGTEEEFTQLMASNATMAETVEYYSWTEEIKTALMACFENVAWVNPDGQTYYDALYAALYDRTWSVTNTLTGCTTSNGAESITKGRRYTATLTPGGAFTLEGATVSVTMGGVDVTTTVYDAGVITIPSVTGDLVITAAAVRTAWSVTNVLTNCTTDNLDDYTEYGQPYTAELTAVEGYEINTVTITMGGVDVSTYYSSGTISIPAVTGDVVITATAAEPPLYELESAFTSTGSNYIDTGVAFQTGEEYTILAEFTLGSSIPTNIRYIFGDIGGDTTYYHALQTQWANNSGGVKVGYIWGCGIGWSVGSGFGVANHKYRFALTLETTNYARSVSCRDVTGGTTKTASGTAQTAAIKGHNIMIGAKVAGETNGFLGTVSQLKIYNRVFSSSEIEDFLTNG